ncbi:MAG: galactose ABC transporter substrate-binding protein [Lachnospiraceae bacterium]|nr:galactose ABC transporter substrate-binding protein [Lachnospiraceae bacterium]
MHTISPRKKHFHPSRLHKVLAFLLAACMAILAGCSSAGQTDSVQTSAEENTDFNVAVFYYDYSDNYVSDVRMALTRYMAQAGIPYSEYDAGANQSTQYSQIDSAIAAHASLLIVNIVNSGSSNTTDSICMKAYRAGIPVIFFNRSIEDNGDEGVILDYYDDVAFVGTDPAEGGHLQGKMIGNYLVDHFDETDLNKDGVISYALFKGEAKNAEAIYRTKYSVEDADEILTGAGYPSLYYFNQSSVDYYQLDLTGKWSSAAVHDYMETNLTQYNEDLENMIELVICNSDSMAEGAIRALQTYGYNLGKEAECTTIPVFGVDASIVGRQLISDGTMCGTIKQDADGMAECILHLSKNVSEGKDLLDDTGKYDWDREHGLKNKLYIPYSVYDPTEDNEAEDDSSA